MLMERNDAAAVVAADLADLVEWLDEEFACMAGMRLLVTGGAGFLGYYLVQAPLAWNRRHPDAAPIRVTVLDNFMRGRPPWLAQLAEDPALELVQHDITRPLPAGLGPFEYVIHGASVASPMFYRKHPIATMDANVGGLRHLLDFALAQQQRGTAVAGFLFFSSSEIYGDPDPAHIPTAEDYRGYVSCTGPRACYDESKRYGETLCVNFARQHGLPVKSARPFNNYGPGLKISDRRALPDFARDACAGRDIVLYSDGSPTRTFCYVSDAVAGYFQVLVRGRGGEAYNIGTEAPEVSIRDLAQRVVALSRELFDYRGELTFARSEDRDYLTDNPNRRCPSIRKAREELGYVPRVTLEEGLRRSLVWYRDNQTAEDA